MKKFYDDDCLSRTGVFDCYKRFQDVLGDEPKAGHPKNKNQGKCVK